MNNNLMVKFGLNSISANLAKYLVWTLQWYQSCAHCQLEGFIIYLGEERGFYFIYLLEMPKTRVPAAECEVTKRGSTNFPC